MCAALNIMFDHRETWRFDPSSELMVQPITPTAGDGFDL
jgi:hypothetical protein